MVLPRPARLLRQYPRLLGQASHYPVHTTHRHFNVSSAASAQARVVEEGVQDDILLDESYDEIFHSQQLGTDPRERRQKSHYRKGISPSALYDSLRAQAEAEVYEVTDIPPEQGSSRAVDQVNRDEEADEWDDSDRRAERRSPAAVLGSKRMGSVILPDELVEVIENALGEVDKSRVRYNYMRLKTEPKIKRSKNPPEVEMALAKASAFLPGEYAAVRNVLREMNTRLGRDWLDRAHESAQAIHAQEEVDIGIQGEREIEDPAVDEEGGVKDQQESPRPRVVEVSAGLGAGLWGLLDSRGSLPSALLDVDESTPAPIDFQSYHSNKLNLDVARVLGTAISTDIAQIDYLRKMDRNFISTTPSLAMSTFFLSTLPSPSPRETHLKALMALSSPYIVLIDHATPEGWESISQARQYILSKSTAEKPLHILAPCPHDGACPLVDTKEICGFSQRLQSPRFLRKTKHTKKGEEDKRYCYLVVARGERPQSTGEEVGRIGGVAQDQLIREKMKVEGKTKLVQIEGMKEGQREQYDMVPMIQDAQSHLQLMRDAEEGLSEGELTERMRNEAYSWPRLVLPPLKRSGHVIMDVCAESGNIERMTYARSHSKQGFYDARKIFWGDLFPHPPQSTVTVRRHGIKHLSEPEMVEGAEASDAFLDELFGFEPGQVEEDNSPDLPGVESYYGSDARRQDARQREKQLKAEHGKFWRQAQEEARARPGRSNKLQRPDLYDPIDNSLAGAGTMCTKDAVRQAKSGREAKQSKGVKDVNEAKKSKRVTQLPEDSIMDEDDFLDLADLDAKPLWMNAGGWEEVTAVRTGPDGKAVIDIQKNTESAKLGNDIKSGRGKRNYSTTTRPNVGLGLGVSMTQKRYMSVRPRDRSSTALSRPKVTISELHRLRASKEPITVLTAYDFPTSLLSESSGIDIVLVGDSLSQVALGHDTTTQITLDEMIHHAKAVTRGAKTPFVIADLPFGSFEASVEKGVESVVRMIKEGGVDGVKIEGGLEIVPLVARLSAMGIPVTPHIGLQPQRATSTSGYLVQGRTALGAQHILHTARELEKAGATMILLEAIPHGLARYITDTLSVPTIGIGAGLGTNGQVLVITDVLGVYAPDPNLDGAEGGTGQPRFVRQFGDIGQQSRNAIGEYINSVKDGSFPIVGKETYGMKKEEWELFLQNNTNKKDEVTGGRKESEIEGPETEDGA